MCQLTCIKAGLVHFPLNISQLGGPRQVRAPKDLFMAKWGHFGPLRARMGPLGAQMRALLGSNSVTWVTYHVSNWIWSISSTLFHQSISWKIPEAWGFFTGFFRFTLSFFPKTWVFLRPEFFAKRRKKSMDYCANINPFSMSNNAKHVNIFKILYYSVWQFS